MPTYEYRCPGCGNGFEKFQRMSDAPAADCPTCGAAAERRISGGAGLVFKGSGFYITDYARGEGYKKAAAADSGAAPSTGGSEGASPAPAADKPAAKPAADPKPSPKSD